LIELPIDKDSQFRILFNCFDWFSGLNARSQACIAPFELHGQLLIKDRKLEEVLQLQLTLAPTAALTTVD
jgi:hypothetical protein